jgi:predicted DNA-binding transcriptional regulator AlpA
MLEASFCFWCRRNDALKSKQDHRNILLPNRAHTSHASQFVRGGFMNTMMQRHAVRAICTTLEPLLTMKDLEDLLRVHRRTISRLCKSGRLPAPIKIGASNRWKLSEINKVLGQAIKI